MSLGGDLFIHFHFHGRILWRRHQQLRSHTSSFSSGSPGEIERNVGAYSKNPLAFSINIRYNRYASLGADSSFVPSCRKTKTRTTIHIFVWIVALRFAKPFFMEGSLVFCQTTFSFGGTYEYRHFLCKTTFLRAPLLAAARERRNGSSVFAASRPQPSLSSSSV